MLAAAGAGAADVGAAAPVGPPSSLQRDRAGGHRGRAGQAAGEELGAA